MIIFDQITEANRIEHLENLLKVTQTTLESVTEQRDDARSEIEKLKEELESHAWTISPAMAQAKIDELVEQRDEAREDLKITQEAWVKARVERIESLRERDEAREQRDRLAEAGKILAEEYEDRRSQWGGEYLWQKYEDAERVDAAIAVFTVAMEGGSDE
jgi:chromosome segregation ATPase